MDIHHIRYFLAVCETRNFTRAAQKCNVTQPALSRAIQQLEDEVGGLLFRRERNLTHITDLGNLLRPRFQQVQDELMGVRTEASKFLCLNDAHLKVGIMCTIGPRRFTGLLTDFNMRHKGIQLQLIEGIPAKLSESARNWGARRCADVFGGEFSGALRHNAAFSRAFHAGLSQRDIAWRSMKPFQFRRSTAKSTSAGSTANTGTTCRISATPRALRRMVSYSSEREDWIQNLVAGGLGICFIPEFSAVIPGLQVRPVTDPEVTRDVCLVTVAGRRFSPAVSAFVGAVKSYGWATSPNRLQ